MPGRAAKITITERQQEILRRLGNSVTASSRLRQRAKIILLAFEGTDNQGIARDIGLERTGPRNGPITCTFFLLFPCRVG